MLSRGHPWASVGVLLSPLGVGEPQAGVLRASGVEEMQQSVAPPGLLHAAAIVKVFISALVEAFPHRCWPPFSVVVEGMVRLVVPVPKRRVWHRQAAPGVVAWRCAA